MLLMVLSDFNPISFIGHKDNKTIVYADFESSISAFPESYKTYLRQLHKEHANWTFTPLKTGIDFDEAVSNECDDKCLMIKSCSEFLLSNASGDYDTKTGEYIGKSGSSWVSASKNAVAYYMDPRNFLNDQHIFIFENLSYNSSAQTQDGVEKLLGGSFMGGNYVAYYNKNGKFKKNSFTYSKAIMDAAKEAGISPYFVASKILNEIGSGGTYTTEDGKTYAVGNSGSINGKNETYPGIYNFYNIGASDGNNAIASGLSWASSGSDYNRPWNTPKKSIVGGAAYLYDLYINGGQYTPYLQKFNVNPNSSHALYTHQYMSSVFAVVAEAESSYIAYNAMGTINSSFNFVIPIYNNMPSSDTTISIGNTKTKTGVMNSKVNVRKGPSVTYDKINSVDKNTAVTILDYVRSDTTGNLKFMVNPYWMKVKYTDGKDTVTGYVCAKYVDLDTTDSFYLNNKLALNVNVSKDETIYYMSDDPAIATVDDKGRVKGIKVGKTTIRAYTTGGKCSAVGIEVCKIGVAFAKKRYYVAKDKSRTITADVYTAYEDKSVTYTSSDETIATIDENGLVKGLEYGEVTITATTNKEKKTATTIVQVVKPVESISLNKEKLSMVAGKKKTLKVTYEPADASVLKVKWSSSNKKIATVNKKGVIKAKKAGKVTITATSVQGKKTATCVVTVKPNKVTGVKVTVKRYDRLKIRWNEVKNITGYFVYRYNKDTDKFERIATVKGKTYYVDKNLTTGKKYIYKVRAYRKVKDTIYKGKYSKEKKGVPKKK